VIKGPVISGDDDLIARVVEAAQDPDDPPIVFAWDSAALETFLAKVAALPLGAPPAPAAFVPLPTVDAGVGPGIRNLTQSFLVHMQTLVPGCAIIGGVGGVAGLACSQLQMCNACLKLSSLQHEPWFAAVLANGPDLPGPLATLLVPRPRVSTGICDPLSCNSILWA
jgi:hypothetical protein